MPKDTAPLTVIGNFFVLAFLIGLLPYGLLGILTGAISVGFLALVALLIAALFNLFMWIGHRLFFFVIHGDDEEYRRFREAGFDPWFDVRNPFVSRGEEPISSGRDSVEGWHCTKCGAEARDLEAPCFQCGHGKWHCGICDALLGDKFAVCPRCGNAPFAN